MAVTEYKVEGIVNFSHITEHDVYQGQDTGAFTVTITMQEDIAADLGSKGVKIRDYQGNKQRKFKSKFPVKVFDWEGEEYEGEIPFNSKVRLLYSLGNEHPVHGVSTYVTKIKVLEESLNTEEDEDFRYG